MLGKEPGLRIREHFLIEFEFTKNLQSEFEFFIFNFASSNSSSVIFLSSSNFCQVLDNFATQSTFFEIEFKFRDFCFQIQVRVWQKVRVRRVRVCSSERNTHTIRRTCVKTLNFCISIYLHILLSRESNQCSLQARLGVASHLSTTPRWGNFANLPSAQFYHQHNFANLPSALIYHQHNFPSAQ